MTTSKQRCVFCGAQLTGASRYCIQCGAPIEFSTESPAPDPINPTISLEETPDFSPEPEAPQPEPAPAFTLPQSNQPPRISTPPSNRKPAWPSTLLIILAICLCLGCIASIGAGTYLLMVREETTPTSVVVITQEVTELPETLFPETALPVPTDMTIEPETPAFQGRKVFTQGIRFNLSKEIAQDVTAEIAPATQGNDLPEWENYPEYTRIGFVNYQSAGETFHKPQLLIYPTDQYAQMNQSAADNIAKLKLTLTTLETPSSDEILPFFPLWNAGQFFHAHFAFLDFQNGSGIRYLTQYGQAIYPINNYSLFYTFQGLTSDERFYLAAIFPVSSPVLPDPETIEMDQQFYDAFLQYIEETKTLLEAQPLDTFTPNLNTLDQLIEGLRIDR